MIVEMAFSEKEDDPKPAILIYPSHDSTLIPLLEILGIERVSGFETPRQF